jgi:hypothetical protein
MEMTMLKKLFIPVITIVLISSIFLSSPVLSKDKPIKFGLRAGINLANVSDDIQTNADTGDPGLSVSIENRIRKTYGVGGFIEYRFGSMVSAQLNVLYSLKGVKVNTVVDGSTFVPELGMLVNVFQETKQTIEYSYLSIPLMGKLAFGGEGATRPYIIAGPEIGVLLSAKTSSLEGEVQAYIPGVAGGAASINASGQDVKDDTEPLEIAVNFGTGIIFPLGNVNLFLDGRYGYGLSKINKQGDENITNNIIYINIGLIF